MFKKIFNKKFSSRLREYFWISHEQIEADLNKGAELIKTKKIVEVLPPETWTIGVNQELSYWKHLFLAIFFGFFGLDRFYLGKKISAITKAITICILNPLMILAIIYLDFIQKDLIVSSVFLAIFFGGIIGFYLVDIFIAIFCPRDIHFRRIIRG